MPIETFTPKDWENAPSTATPISAAALQDLEARLAAYTGDESDALAAAVGSRYHDIIPWRSIVVPQSTGAATLFIPGAGSTGIAAGTTDSPLAVVYLDPADVDLEALATKYRVDAVCLTNATAPAITFTVGLYPISAVAGGSNAVTLTAGTVQAGSTVAFASQAASTRGQGNSGDFAAPTAGYYALGVVLSGTNAANSRVVIGARMRYRNV